MQCPRFMWILALFLIPEPTPVYGGDIVKIWARNLGEELWKLSESLTKSDQIRIKYKQMNASVKKKDGNQILESSLRSVSTMLTRKINAVKCIHATAEELARNFNYSMASDKDYKFKFCSAKYSNFTYENEEDKPPVKDIPTPAFVKDNLEHYMNVTLEKDSHFYEISVNTNISCVHVPTNIFFKENKSKNAILWSKGLNDIFIKNYKSDPSLAWQYFGSADGILRFYPGMPWNKQQVDTYDCRVMSWYIEAATCSKDVIILFDVSGSMTGFKNYVARRTLRSLLDTLSNNDYVNVFYFNKEVGEVVKCFIGLVQATKENIISIREMLQPFDEGDKHNVHNYPLEGNANLTLAYIKAFTTLKSRRMCNVTSTQGCNQLVMLITDYVPDNLTEVFDEYNREVVDGKTYIPVRVFTYLIGKEVTNIAEIKGMACTNRGYFVHIHSVEEVQQQVLKYINVIARPMILHGADPPPLPTWTHASIDNTRTETWSVSSDKAKPDEDKLVTSVAIPAFDYKYNEENNDAMLLGVAGTDVPIDSIAKLAQPHQLGVNGYSFIVSNNGYLLLHPLLTTTINGVLQDNYNSVDFVEVEQVDDGKGPRELGEEITSLREHLANGDEGFETEVKVLYHYDHMRRIARVKHDYFFNALPGTPFSMGISLPREYGDTELLLKDNPLEAKQGKELTGINVTDYFRFSYRVHPDWVYCKYHYLEGHEYDHPEQDIWKFLGRLSRNNLNITKKQYDDDSQNKNFSVSTHCGNATVQRDTDDYYCNEDLVKQLVFDAKLTAPYFENWHATEEEWEMARQYNVSVRFVATSSGLTRWHYIFEPDKNEKVDDFGNRKNNFDGKVFGDKYITAIEETWYKAAVLQHSKNNTESLVIATRLPILDDMIEDRPKVVDEDGDITVTSSYAIFYKDGDSETPASVVGFQFKYSSFYERFLQLTERARNSESDISCNGTEYECYVIDSSGYIVLSRNKDHVGQFFGVIHKYVLQSLIDKMIFDRVEVFNYQALCPANLRPKPKEKGNSASSYFTPFIIMKNLLAWILTEAVILTSNLFKWTDAYAGAAVVDDSDYFEVIHHENTGASTTAAPPIVADETVKAKDANEAPFSCDHQISLYILNQTFFLEAAQMGAAPLVSDDSSLGECHPTYWATYVTKTNLLLVVIKNEDIVYHRNCKKPPDTKPVHTYNSTLNREPCHKLELGRLFRRRLEGCYTYNEKEKDITECGLGSTIRSDTVVFTVATLSAIAASKLLL